MKSLDTRLLRVEVIDLQDDVYYGNLVLESNGNIVNIDSRPSDALALAVRMHVPILVAANIMENAGIIPEQDLQDEPGTMETKDDAPIEPGEDRLSVFEDFLQNLGEEADDEPPADDEEPDVGAPSS
jgi:bifunctional DNase/RNase